MNDKSERIGKKEIVAFRRVTILMCLLGGTEEEHVDPVPGYPVPGLKFGSSMSRKLPLCVSRLYNLSWCTKLMRACVKRSTQVPCCNAIALLYAQVTVHRDKLHIKQPTRFIKQTT